MSRSSYLFRMFPDDVARLDALAPRFGGKRETLSAALRALEREETERQAESMEAKTSVLARIQMLEERVAALEANNRPGSAAGSRRGRQVR